MYVPRPLELTVASSETPLEQLAKELLWLSKLNWNNTQFDGGEPITRKSGATRRGHSQMRLRGPMHSTKFPLLYVMHG
jgi:hypothetical protein